MLNNTQSRVNKYLGTAQSTNALNSALYRNRVNKLYGNKNNIDKLNVNPFLDSNGNLFNNTINYQNVLDNPKTSFMAKKFIQEATGLTPTATKTYETADSGTNYTNNYKAVAGAAQSVPASTAQSYSGGSQNTSNSLVNTAKKYLGTKYVWGGAAPGGFDCSGLMQYVYKQNGISIPRVSQQQFKTGTAVSKENLKAGDLVFFKGSDGSAQAPGHVGMYIGNGQYIQAPKTGDVVKISNLSGRNDYVGARRISK